MADTTEPTAEPKPAKRASYRGDMLWMLAGNVVFAGAQWGMVISVAKTTDVGTVGDFALALALATPIVFFANLGLRSVIATDVQNEYQFRDYFGLRTLTLGLFLLSLLLIGVAARYSTNTMTVVMLVGLAKALDSLSDLMYGLLQRNNMIRCVAQSRIAQGSIQLVSFYLLLRNTGDLPLALVGSTFGLGLVFLLFDLRNARLALKVQAPDGGKTSMVPSYSPPILKKIAALSLPLGLIYFFDTLIINVPRYGLDHFQGRDAVGYYSALAYLIVAGTTVVTAMAEASRTRLALAYVKSASTYFGQVRKLLVLAGGIGLLGCIFSWTLGPWMLAVVYRKDYAAYGYVLNLLMVSAALWYVAIFLAAALTSARQFASQVPLFAVGAIATGIGTWVLVPTHGLAGAALALGAGMLVRIGGGALQLGRVLRNAPQAAPASGPNPT